MKNNIHKKANAHSWAKIDLDERGWASMSRQHIRWCKQHLNRLYRRRKRDAQYLLRTNERENRDNTES